MLPTLLKTVGVYTFYEKWLQNIVTSGDMPEHVGIILDGNRRWSFEKYGDKLNGHFYGAKTAEDFLIWCLDLGIRTVTLYVFSTENFQRSPKEVSVILSIIEDETRRLITDDEHYLNIAVAYGGRAEIVDAAKRIIGEVKNGMLDEASVDEDVFTKYLYTSHLPNPYPELIIRTSGEERLSGFLIWQAAYSEFVFLDVYWPEFRRIDLLRAVRTYQRRRRRFGN